MTAKPDELEQILQSYKGDTQAVDEDAVLRQYPEKLNQAHDDNLQEAKQAIQAHVDKRVNEARIDEWKLISEVTHSANLVANNYLSKARDERIKQLRSEL